MDIGGGVVIATGGGGGIGGALCQYCVAEGAQVVVVADVDHVGATASLKMSAG